MLGRALTILCLLGLLVLGCGQKPQESAAPKPEGEGKPAAKADEAQNAQEGPVTLTFWHILNYEGPREVIEQAISRFRRANPNAQVKAQPQDNDSYKAKLDMEMASGTPPDVFQTWGGGKLWQFAKAGLVRNITYEMNENRGAWRKRFMEKPARLCSFQGKFYAAPLVQ
jgi:raffinose/stachyose/melibiose transport system substrate-binding protein